MLKINNLLNSFQLIFYDIFLYFNIAYIIGKDIEFLRKTSIIALLPPEYVNLQSMGVNPNMNADIITHRKPFVLFI